MNVYERVGEPGRDGSLPAFPLSQAARLEEEAEPQPTTKLPLGTRGCLLVRPRTRAPNSTHDASHKTTEFYVFYTLFQGYFVCVLTTNEIIISGRGGRTTFNIWNKITQAAEKMNTCLVSKQNGFSKFPPGKRDLSSLGAGSSSLPSLLPTPTSTFSFFIF